VNKIKWKNICEDKEKRPEVQQYRNWEELPPIPISLPIEASMGMTGDWRTFRPIINKELCTKCGICAEKCPSQSILSGDRLYDPINVSNSGGGLKWPINGESCRLY